MKVQNKVIVVTGSGNGMGRELTLNLLARNASVAAVDVNPSALQETVVLAGDKKDALSTHLIDITDREAVAALPAQVTARHGVVDGLINCAGIIQPFVKVNDLDFAVIERVMNVNFFGTFYMIKAFLPLLLQRPEAHIANVSSMGGFLPVPGQTIYGASKAAVKLLTEGLHSELENTKVHVTVIFPGAIGTNIAVNSGLTHMPGAGSDRRRQPIKPLSPSKAAQIILDGIEKNRYRILVGQDAAMMDLLYRASSKHASQLIYRQMQSLLHD